MLYINISDCLMTTNYNITSKLTLFYITVKGTYIVLSSNNFELNESC